MLRSVVKHNNNNNNNKNNNNNFVLKHVKFKIVKNMYIIHYNVNETYKVRQFLMHCVYIVSVNVNVYFVPYSDRLFTCCNE